MPEFDVIVIGGGWGGYTAAVRARQHGLRTALVERDKLGGTCLHRGCIPTKALIETAELLSISRRGADYGLKLGEPQLDYARVLQRKGEVVAQLFRGLQQLVKSSGATLIEADARLTGPASVVARGASGQESELTAKAIILATGSRPKALPGVTADGQTILDSDQILDREQVPASLLILGAGAVGVEFASCFNDYGAAVTLVEMLPRVLPLEDADLSTALTRSLTKRGIRVETGVPAIIESISTGEGGVSLEIELAGKRERLQGEALLVAVGRDPLTRGMGIEEQGVRLERGFVVVDEQMRTSVPGVYAVGDCNGRLMLAHVAAAQGVFAADQIAGKSSPLVDFERLPRVTFCRPQVASVGLTEEQARATGRPIKTARTSLRANGKALINGEPDGFVKLVCDESNGDVLGIHMLGDGVTELIAAGSLARFLDASVEELALNVFPHPTLSEILGDAAHAALRAPQRREGTG
jgi:dihydrolipoamide dehydrogenase